MSSRKIKDAKDLSTNELIYFKGHAKATYMSDGTTVEDAINNIEGTGGGGNLNVQSDWNETDTTSDAYIKNKPTIPSAVTESTVSGWGFTKNTGTVTGVKVNGSTKNPSSGIVDLGTVITAVDSSMSSTSTNSVQNKVIKSYIDSNCNIPTETTTASSKSLTANKYCRWTNTPTSITITLATPSNTSIVNNYMFEFTASSSGCTLSVPSTIKWINGTVPSIEAGKTYQISIINNLATIAKFS